MLAQSDAADVRFRERLVVSLGYLGLELGLAGENAEARTATAEALAVNGGPAGGLPESLIGELNLLAAALPALDPATARSDACAAMRRTLAAAQRAAPRQIIMRQLMTKIAAARTDCEGAPQ